MDQYAIDEANCTGGEGGGGGALIFLRCKRPTSSMTCKRNGTRLLHTTSFYVLAVQVKQQKYCTSIKLTIKPGRRLLSSISM